MGEQWEFYFTSTQDHKPASVFIDVGLQHRVPIVKLRHLVRVQLDLLQPRPDGLSSSDEAPRLFAIEDALKQCVCQEPEMTLLVARITAEGKREFFLYSASEDGHSLGFHDLQQRFPEHNIQVQVIDDPKWETYKLLLPNDEQWQEIEDQKVCEALQRNGDELSQSREIDHWIYFDKPDARDRFIAEAAGMGFQVRCLLDGKPAFGDFGVQIFRSDIPAFATISSVTIPLYRLAQELGGEYDGWETEAIDSNPA